MKNTFNTTVLALIILLFIASCSSEVKRNRDIPYDSLETVMTNLSPLVQTFQINPTKENVMEGEKGTVIYIPADVFQFEDGSTPTGEVRVELKECYSLTEMIGEGLGTTCGDQLLETAGMLHLTATADGKSLIVQDGKAFVVSFPKNKATEEMDLFYNWQFNYSASTWVPDYRMFEVETKQNAILGPVLNEVDIIGSEPKPVYPIEMTPDLFDKRFDIHMQTATFDELLLKGENRTILDYIKDPKMVDTAILNDYCRNEWLTPMKFKIDENGKMNSFRFEQKGYTSLNVNKTALATAIKFLESIPAFDLESYKREEIDPNHYFALGFHCTEDINWDRFKLKFREKYATYTNKAIEKLDQNALNYYTFAATNLGWINCDRFFDLNETEKTNFALKNTSPNHAKAYLIFKDINSVMEGSNNEGPFIFPNVPIGMAVKVVGISYADGKPMMATAETTIKKEGFELTGYRAFSLDELEAALNN